MMGDLTPAEVDAINNRKIRDGMTVHQLKTLRDRVIESRNQRHLSTIDAEIRWREMNGY